MNYTRDFLDNIDTSPSLKFAPCIASAVDRGLDLIASPRVRVIGDILIACSPLLPTQSPLRKPWIMALALPKQRGDKVELKNARKGFVKPKEF